jgi:hypothetical protein
MGTRYTQDELNELVRQTLSEIEVLHLRLRCLGALTQNAISNEELIKIFKEANGILEEIETAKKRVMGFIALSLKL